MFGQRSSLGLFGFFGRSEDLRALDRAFRAVDLHPRLVPEAVKLTAIKLLRDRANGREPAPQGYRAAAELIGYCMIGAAAFAHANGAAAARAVERRIEAAVAAGGGLDAELVLLTLHAGVIQPSVVHAFRLESTGA
jgi:hypothetical protein